MVGIIGKTMAPGGGLSTARVGVADRDGALLISVSGWWTVRQVADVDKALRGIAARRGGRAVFDLSALDHLDTAGAWLIERIRRRLADSGMAVETTGARAEHDSLLRQVSAVYAPCDIAPPQENPFLGVVRRIGGSVVSTGQEVVNIFGFAGLVLVTLTRVLPFRLRWTSLVHHMEQAGLNAVPIICLMSFLVGSVIAFLGASILQDYGVEALVINMLSYSILREFGVFLTAIMVAGRSGSAFTAQIGSMKGREEIDAMRVLGLDPIELLVAPRVLALLITVPLLTFLSDVAGLVGGGLASWVALDVSPVYFLSRLREMITTYPHDLWAGFIKAPVFAFLIGLIGCYQGLKVEGSAESVGNRTTLSVVESIFVVIVFDAAFAAYFLAIDF